MAAVASGSVRQSRRHSTRSIWSSGNWVNACQAAAGVVATMGTAILGCPAPKVNRPSEVVTGMGSVLSIKEQIGNRLDRHRLARPELKGFGALVQHHP